MIKTVAELLAKFKEEETRRLNDYELSHGPIIGAMYEGLTTGILEKAIPSELNLNVVSGFMTDGSEHLSPQIDCMLVRGEGESIPYTNSFKWHVKDVIAVFEVKKTLYSDDFADSYSKLRDVLERHSRYAQSDGTSDVFNISPTCRAFAETTGIIPPPYKKASSLPFDKEIIYHILVIEQLSPIRIALGYNGFRSEHSFREGLYKFLKNNLNKPGFGVGSFPQLSISGQFSLVKMNGQPYSAPLDNGWWHFLASSSINPVQLLLEFIWTRLSHDYLIGGLWGEDLDLENFNCCLKGRIKQENNKEGWEYQYINLSEKSLRESTPIIEWQPTTVDATQFVIFSNLCKGREERINDPQLIKYVETSGYTMESFINALLSTGMVALSGDTLRLTTELCQCAILPDRGFVVAENNTGRFTRWLNKKMAEKKA